MNQFHFEKFISGTKNWGEWIKEYKKTSIFGPELSDISVSGKNIEEYDLTDAEFHDSKLTSCRFTLCTMSGSRANTANFSNSIFKGCGLEISTFEQCDFSNCVFIDCPVFHSAFVSCNFYNSKFLNSPIQGCNFTESNFKKSSFHKVQFTSCNLSGANFEDSDLEGIVSLENSILRDIIVNKGTRLKWNSRELIFEILFQSCQADPMKESFCLKLWRNRDKDLYKLIKESKQSWATKELRKYKK